jgi:hypothetical protein
MADLPALSFSEASLLALGSSSTELTDAQTSNAERIFANGDNGVRARLLRRAAYNQGISSGVIPAGTSIDAVPWANLIQLLMTLLPTLIPLICPPTPPKPSLPPGNG